MTTKSKKGLKKVFVSGCYDILHAGHVEFFRQAKALGDYLIVSFASDEVLMKYKGRKSALPEEHKKFLLENISVVDEVVKGENLDDPIFDFKDSFLKLRPDILASTEDDKHAEEKREFCLAHGAQYIQLPKTLGFEKISTTEMRESIMVPAEVHVRVDFAGGWLDVPKFSRKGAYIVNCTIDSSVSLTKWQYQKGAGLGGSAAHAVLTGFNPIKSELSLGVGWQDPAVILETGLCVWRSGKKPVLELKANPDFLKGTMALFWTGENHYTPGTVFRKRNYDAIELAGKTAHDAVVKKDFKKLCKAVGLSYKAQLEEGMKTLPLLGEISKKYCGGGYGGYALYMFESETARKKFLKNKNTLAIEPYIREY
ncbi:MAG: adenylyltransferase/cytidyltransferase family protein [bacterium]